MSLYPLPSVDVIQVLSLLHYKFMGHGQCVTYNKQSALAGLDGRATSDPRVIGSLSWRLLRTLSIPPRELRGISIQIQKLDAHTGSILAPVQAHLPFRPAPNPPTTGTIVGPAPKARAPPTEPVTAQPEPKGPAAGADLPSFSQVDMSVFEALPEDIRKELEAEYNRRSAPAPNKSEPPADLIPRANSAIPYRGGGNERLRSRGTDAVSSRGRRGSLGRDQARGAASWVLRPRGRGRGRGDGAGGPSRGGLLAFLPAPAPMVHVKPGELAELGIDAEVFAALPRFRCGSSASSWPQRAARGYGPRSSPCARRVRSARCSGSRDGGRRRRARTSTYRPRHRRARALRRRSALGCAGETRGRRLRWMARTCGASCARGWSSSSGTYRMRRTSRWSGGTSCAASRRTWARSVRSASCGGGARC